MGSMIFLALIIVLVSGLIAYVGDLVGRKMGRKRLTLFGLRPRHTAIVISVGVGMLIAALTLSATLAVNRTIREAFFTPLGKVKADLQQARADLENAKQETEQARTQLQAQRSQLEQSHAMRQEIEKKLRQQRVALDRAQGEYSRVKRDLQGTRTQLRVSTTKLHELDRQLTYSKTTLDTVTKDIKKLVDDKNLFEGVAIDLVNGLVFSPLSFTYGQEILSGYLPNLGTDLSRRLYLERFFATADRVVRQWSVDLPQDATAIIFLSGDKDNLKRISEQEAIDILVKRINKLGGKNGVVIYAAAVNNVPLNGPAFLAVDRIELIPDEPVFRAGSVVAKVDLVIGESTPLSDIVGKLADDLLRQKLPEALRAKGMLPITRRFDPAHPEAIPPADTPTVSWGDVAMAVEKARNARGKVSLAVRAQTDVTKYGPLKINLDVVPAQ